MEQSLVDEIKKDLKETIANILKDPDVVETYLAKTRPKKVRTQFEESCIKEMVKLAQEVQSIKAFGNMLARLTPCEPVFAPVSATTD